MKLPVNRSFTFLPLVPVRSCYTTWLVGRRLRAKTKSGSGRAAIVPPDSEPLSRHSSLASVQQVPLGQQFVGLVEPCDTCRKRQRTVRPVSQLDLRYPAE